MLAAFFGFMAGILLTWPSLIVLLVLGGIFEHYSCHGWAIFTAMVSLTVAYFFFAIPLLTLLIYSLAYLVIGFLWSFWRYKRHVDSEVDKANATTDLYREAIIKQLHPTRMVGIITIWVIVWPFSLIENVIGDIINLIQTLIQKVFKTIYFAIYNSAMQKLNLPK